MSHTSLPDLVLAYYGDDFTGSTDVMEVLALAGLPTTLFLAPPTSAQLARYPGSRAIGMAGGSRARSPVWMDQNLPLAFSALHALHPRLLHYKVCSTFDSAPDVGSIGRALDIGRRVLGEQVPTPIVVGAPALKRYCAFGNLFATVNAVTHRLDRHPTMSRHPVTPMNESDLRRHLGGQTKARIELFDLLALSASGYRERYAELCRDGGDAVLIDVLDQMSLERAGEIIWETSPAARYSTSSSGLEYALVAHWRAAGLLPRQGVSPRVKQVEQAVGVSGSCSPATAAQIEFAERAGWGVIAADPCRLADSDEAEQARLLDLGHLALKQGRSAVIHSASGPDDPRTVSFNEYVGADAQRREQANNRIGAALGGLLRELIIASGVRRAFVAGGDTSSAAAHALGIEAVTIAAPLTPGSPLCRAHAPGDPLDGIEISFKGGQTGSAEFFEAVRLGRIDAQPQPGRRETCLQ